MQLWSSRIRLWMAKLNIITQWCAEYNIDIIAPNIPQMKITAVSQWTARFNIQRKPEKCWCLLRNLSFGLFDHKKIPVLFRDFSKISVNFRTFQGSFRTRELSRTFQDCWEPCLGQFYKKSHTCGEDGAYLRISFWHLLMNLKNK